MINFATKSKLSGAVLTYMAVATQTMLPQPTFAQQPSSVTSEGLPGRLVQDLHAVFGQHHARAVHAKGVVLRGKFEPAAGASRLSSAIVFRGPVPVIVRFSNFTGLPTIPDFSPNADPRGLAVKFLPPHAEPLDIVTHSFNGFPTATAEEFSQLFRAIAASGPDAPKPTALDRFLDAHLKAKEFLTTQKPPPESYATAAYFGVNAFELIPSAGTHSFVRYRLVPEAGEHYLGPDALQGKGPNYLEEEIKQRVSAPVRFTWYAQLAEKGDRVDDPSIAWPESRKLIKLGTITIDAASAGSRPEDESLVFLPGNVPQGIGLADPMVAIRNAAYRISLGERRAEGESQP
jgi:catalase